MMPEGEDEATSLSAAADIEDTSNRNGGVEEAFSAAEDADEIVDVAVPRSNSNPLQDDDDLVAALEGDRREHEGKEHIGNEGENATAVAATQQEAEGAPAVAAAWR